MKMYCIIENGVIINIIICETDEIAAEFDALPSYDGAKIGEKYNPPIPISQMDRLEAQATYTAMMTDTLIGG